MLTGEIPPALATLRHLEFLWLNNNQLSGGIPAALGDLSQLLELSLYNNQLTGEIPAEVAALPNLKRIGFFNNQLSGCVPIGLWSKLASVYHDDGTPVGAVALPWCDAVQLQVALPPLNPTLIEACASGAVLASLSQSQELLNDCTGARKHRLEIGRVSGWMDRTSESAACGSAAMSWEDEDLRCWQTLRSSSTCGSGTIS